MPGKQNICNKLRRQQSRAGAITVFVMTSRFAPEGERYTNSRTLTFDMPSDWSLSLSEGATGDLP